MTTAPDGPGHESLRAMLGAHALGHLDDTETAEIEAHLHTCPACRADLAAIAPLAGPLAHVDPDATHGTGGSGAGGSGAGGFGAGGSGAGEFGAGGFAGVRRALDAEPQPARDADRDELAPRRRRAPRALRPLLAAAAAVAIGLAGVGVGLALAGAGEPAVAPVAVQSLDPTVRASAGTIDHTWGVEVVLTASGFAEGQRYEVAVLDRSGRPVPAGAFRGTGGAEMVCRLNSSVLLDQAGGFVVTDADGDEVLRSRFA